MTERLLTRTRLGFAPGAPLFQEAPKFLNRKKLPQTTDITRSLRQPYFLFPFRARCNRLLLVRAAYACLVGTFTIISGFCGIALGIDLCLCLSPDRLPSRGIQLAFDCLNQLARILRARKEFVSVLLVTARQFASSVSTLLVSISNPSIIDGVAASFKAFTSSHCPSEPS